MCGIIYVNSHQRLPVALLNTLESLIRHRGQDNTGVCVREGDSFQLLKDSKLPSSGYVFGDWFEAGVGVRYATVGVDESMNYTPSVFEGKVNNVDLRVSLDSDESVVVFLNGQAQTNWVDEFLECKDYFFNATNDTARLTGLIKYQLDKGRDLLSSVKKTLALTPGAYAINVMSGDEAVIARGLHGTRPLELYLGDGLIVASSETQVFDLFDKQYHFKPMKKDSLNHYNYFNGWRRVYPGELINVKGGRIVDCDTIRLTSDKLQQPFMTDVRQCLFDLVYFANPAGYCFGIPVMKFRGRLGSYLSPINEPVVSDPSEDLIVVPVPDSGRSAADGYASFYGYKKREALIKNKSLRTFISPGQDYRLDLASKKYLPVSYVFARLDDDGRGNELVFIDDSIVRGTTAPFIIANALIKGAEKIHFKSSSDKVVNSCHYGIDIESEDELLASNKSLESILQVLIDRANDLISEQYNVRATTDNVSIEYVSLGDMIKCANGFYAYDYLHKKKPDWSKDFKTNLIRELCDSLSIDLLLNQERINGEVRRGFTQQFYDLIDESVPQFIPKRLLEKLTKQRWCTSCFGGSDYHTCVSDCSSCNDCAKLFNQEFNEITK